MSHAHTVIEPTAGLTVLTGPNNIGKSAIVAALQILCRNENSTYVMRHGEKQCSVKIDTDDMHHVEWCRKNAPSYVIDGQVFDRLKGSGLPEELHQALRMPTVDASGDDDFDIHFGVQKSPIFLLASSSATAARFFASSSDAHRLIKMQKRHREKLAETQREKIRLQAELIKVNEDLDILEPIVSLDQTLTATERTYHELVDTDTWMEQAEKHEASLRGCTELVATRTAFEAVLTAVSVPPTLEDSGLLDPLILAIENQQRAYDAASAYVESLNGLSATPQLADTEPLMAIIAAVDLAESQHTAAAFLMDSLGKLIAPPSLEDAVALETLTTNLAATKEMVRRDTAEVNRLARLTVPPTLEDLVPLGHLVERLAASTAEATAAAERQIAYALTVLPPTLVNEAPLAALLGALQNASAEIEQGKLLTASLQSLSPLPTAVDTVPLASLINELENRSRDFETAKLTCEAASTELKSVTDRIRTAAAQNVCSVCGGVLDADRLIAIATTPGREASDG